MKVSFTTSMYKSPLKDGTCPIVILVSWRDEKSRSRRKRIGESCLEGDFYNGRVSNYVRGAESINQKIEESLAKAHRIYRENFENRVWNFDDWSRIYDKLQYNLNFTQFAEQTIQRYFDDETAGTGFYYKDCMRALQKFLGKEQIRFDEITKPTLKRMEEEMRSRGVKGDRTMRGLKALFGKAVEDEVTDMKLMPFKTGYNPIGYKFTHLKKLKDRQTKKIDHLSNEQIEAIKNYKPKDEAYQRSKDIWLFSYYTMGVNLKDILLLMIGDIKGDTWYFDREKTSTGYDSTFLRPECLEIISRYLKPESKYVFDYLNGYDQNDKTIKRRVNDVNSNLRRKFKKMSEELGFDGYFVMYSARFSSGAKAREEGVDIRALQSAYRHASVTTTEGYLPKKVDKSVYEVL